MSRLVHALVGLMAVIAMLSGTGITTAATAAPTSAAAASEVLFEHGDQSSGVRIIQARLRQIDFYDGDVTGSFDDKTRTAVRKFQKKEGLPVTGAVDRPTLRTLVNRTDAPTQAELTNQPPPPQDVDRRCLTGRVLCVDKTTSTLRWVVDGRVKTSLAARFGGPSTPTREGAFQVFRKSRDHVSSLYDTPMPFAMFFSGGQAVHYSPDFAANGSPRLARVRQHPSQGSDRPPVRPRADRHPGHRLSELSRPGTFHVMIELSKGQDLALTGADGQPLTRLLLGIGWDKIPTAGAMGTGAPDVDLDGSVFQFADGQFFDMAFYNNLETRDGSVTHLGDNLTGRGQGDDETITVDLSRVYQRVDTIVLMVSSYHGHTLEWINNAYCRLVERQESDDSEVELARFTLTAGVPETGLVMATLVRSGEQWTLRAIGEGIAATIPTESVEALRRFV